MNKRFHIDSTTGRLLGAHYMQSPHRDDRPNPRDIDLIVLHNISLPPGQFGNGAVQQFFCGHLDKEGHPYFLTIAELRVSAHLLIDRTGSITQFVPFHERAWHAGVSQFQGRTECNDFSLGIELEGSDHTPFTGPQYSVLAHVIRLLMALYKKITPDRIVGHSTIAPDRKTDPGPFFDWAYLNQSLIQLVLLIVIKGDAQICIKTVTFFFLA